MNIKSVGLILLLLGLVLLLLSSAAVAEPVIGVSAGDTLTVLRDRQPMKIRLSEIDAPEKSQPFGNRSKQSLSELCYGKDAEIIPLTTDRYGRTVARVKCAGTDANAAQIDRGMAWVFRKYASKDSPLYQLERHAKDSKHGLWADSAPVEPWEWRAAKRRRAGK